jgi:hypothetical protein
MTIKAVSWICYLLLRFVATQQISSSDQGRHFCLWQHVLLCATSILLLHSERQLHVKHFEFTTSTYVLQQLL